MKVHAPGLAGRLALVAALLVGLAVAAVSVYAVGTLRDLAEAEALTRVELAVAAGREAIRQSAEDLYTATRVLGDRPTLKRLLESDNLQGLEPYLARYCDAAALDGCALVRDRAVIVSTDDHVDWDRLLAAAAEQGHAFFATGALSQTAAVGAQAAVPDEPGVLAITLRRMDHAFAARLSERTGLEIRIVDYASFRPGTGELRVLDSDALSRGREVAGYVEALDAYAASSPVTASTGETIALLHALLPANVVMDPVDTLTRRILAAAVLVAALATTSGILIGRHWIAGVHRLTSAARRLGSGDLAASIPEESGKELAVLGNTMEEMRRNLVQLTDELRRREAEAQAVLGGIVEGVYAVDVARRIRFVNPQAERLLKVSAEDAVGRFCGEVLTPKRDEQGRRPCEHACPIVRARRLGSAQAVERIEPFPGFSRRVVISSAAPSDGVQVQVLRDETELEAVRRTRDTVLANISHEFRTPLAAQLASIELLRDGLGRMKPEDQRELVFSLERGVVRLTWLIDNLLESVRIESEQLAIRNQEVHLADALQGARELIEPLVEQRGQRIEAQRLDDLPAIRGDLQRLTQVFVNLLANASKFGPTGSTIHIGAEETAGTVAFWIEDEGPGPADEDDGRLFEQFRRSGGEDPEESGLGLGLFIVRSIVERHGGTVRLSRTGEGRTRARVELPRGRV